MTSQCPLEHCMLSDPDGLEEIDTSKVSLNALSSIVCFLTIVLLLQSLGFTKGLNALV